MVDVRGVWAPELRDELAKLIRVLGSSHEGEVLAATLDMRHALASHGLNLHDLAAIVLGHSEALKVPGAPSPGPAPQAGTLDHTMRDIWLGACRTCINHPAELTAAGLAFVREMEARLADGRPCERADLDRLHQMCRRVERSRRT
jgi:hypothetical protein